MEDEDDFFEEDICELCLDLLPVGCWNGDWLCYDCYIDSLDNDDLLERIEHG